VGFHDRTVFAGASTIKTAIMLNAYANLERFDKLEQTWLEEMIVESDNLAANGLLAAAAGGQGTEYAFEGADAMSVMLEEQLGLRHTYLFVPYETADYIKLYKPKFRCGPAGPVGEKPYTEMGACLRAEPASMARLYVLIDECASGEGLLLDEFEKLSPRRCQEMLDRLAENGDTTRMVAGVPEGVRVEHKSGWIEDMQADVGIVRSPGGDYVLAVYVYRPLLKDMFLWKDEVMAPAVAAFSHLAYTAYNPVPLDEIAEAEDE
jgi:beta-lactamase class A